MWVAILNGILFSIIVLVAVVVVFLCELLDFNMKRIRPTGGREENINTSLYVCFLNFTLTLLCLGK